MHFPFLPFIFLPLLNVFLYFLNTFFFLLTICVFQHLVFVSSTLLLATAILYHLFVFLRAYESFIHCFFFSFEFEELYFLLLLGDFDEIVVWDVCQCNSFIRVSSCPSNSMDVGNWTDLFLILLGFWVDLFLLEAGPMREKFLRLYY